MAPDGSNRHQEGEDSHVQNSVSGTTPRRRRPRGQGDQNSSLGNKTQGGHAEKLSSYTTAREQRRNLDYGLSPTTVQTASRGRAPPFHRAQLRKRAGEGNSCGGSHFPEDEESASNKCRPELTDLESCAACWMTAQSSHPSYQPASFTVSSPGNQKEGYPSLHPQ